MRLSRDGGRDPQTVAVSRRHRGRWCARTPMTWWIAAASGGLACATARPHPASPSPRNDLRRSIDSVLADTAFRGGRWGILIVDPARGDTLYSRDAGKLFMPASNQKLVTGAVALARLGPDYRFRTSFYARGAIRADTLFGDLVIQGRGDPTLSDHMRGDALAPLRDIADSLVAHGVRYIAGRLVPGGDAFPGPNIGFGWEWDDLPGTSGAGVDELFFNEGSSRVRVRAGTGDRPTLSVATTPVATYPRVVVAATVAAAAPETPARTRLDVTWPDPPAGAIDGVLLVGSLAPGDSAALSVAYPDPAAAYLAALAQALGERGIRTSGGYATQGRVPADTLRDLARLFVTASPPLRDILRAMAKPSQNQIAEILLKTLGLEASGVGTADSGRRVVERQLQAWGVPSDGFVVRDGSGLSRHDLVTPEAIVRVLDAVRRDTAFSTFYESLPIAGVDGTIANRLRGTPAQGNVHAKTGTLDRVRSLSGYVTTADHRMLLFSILANEFAAPTRTIDRAADAIVVRLATLAMGDR